MTSINKKKISTIFLLEEYEIEYLFEILKTYKKLYINGVCYDAGVGMTMSCRPPSPNDLMVFVKKPNEDKVEDYIQFNTIAYYSNNLMLNDDSTFLDKKPKNFKELDKMLEENIIIKHRKLPDNSSIYIHKELLEELIEAQLYSNKKKRKDDISDWDEIEDEMFVGNKCFLHFIFINPTNIPPLFMAQIY